MCPTKDRFLHAFRSSIPLILLYVVDDIPLTREPSLIKFDASLNWRRRNKLTTLGSLNTANMKKGREQVPASLITPGSG